MRIAFRAILAFSLAACGLGADDTAATAARISSVERRLPWFFSPATEGLADVPYTYRALLTRRTMTGDGREIPPAAGKTGLGNYQSLELERIPLDWGSFMKCLSVDGNSPCTDEWNEELAREAKQRDALTAEDRARIDTTREARRERRRNFWDDFPAAFGFAAAGANEIRFAPLAGYKPQRGVKNGMLTGVSGRLWFDAGTGEVTRLEYNLLRDVDEPFVRLPKGSHFEVALERSSDGHYLPHRIVERRVVAKTGQTDERTTVFSNFRRFDADSKIQFGDPK